jgi:hypothetical protein
LTVKSQRSLNPVLDDVAFGRISFEGVGGNEATVEAYTAALPWYEREDFRRL